MLLCILGSDEHSWYAKQLIPPLEALPGVCRFVRICKDTEGTVVIHVNVLIHFLSH